MSVKMLEMLADPAGFREMEEFSPVPFWFFNDRFDPTLVQAQLRDYVDKGVNAFVLHPRIGLPVDMPYLSDAYFDAVEQIVEMAAGLHMRVVLYDEGMYPSGSAHGQVVAENPAYASVGITLRDEPTGRKVLCRLDDGRYLVEDFSGGNIRGIHFGEDDGEAGAPASADILNPEAVECFLRLTHERYYARLAKYFGNTIIAFFTDEPCVLGRNTETFRDWTPGLEEEILAGGGRLAELAGLFTGEENATTRLYRELVRKRLCTVFYGKLSNWCEAHGIALMGHPAESSDMDEEVYFHIPGQDLIMRRVSPESGGLLEPDSVQGKCSADMARLLGRRRNANECYGVCVRDGIPWYMTGADMKWFTDWLALRGVNLFVPHAFYYSVSGLRSGERPPDCGPNNIWWPYYRQFSDYIKRLSYLNTDSKSAAKIAVLCRSNALPCREVAPLYESQREFTYLPVSLLPSCSVEEGKLHIGDQAFDAVVNLAGPEYNDCLPGMSLSEEIPEQIGTDLMADDPGLRVIHGGKEGCGYYLLSKEAGEDRRISLSVPTAGVPVWMDLWSGEMRFADAAEQDGRLHLSLMLRRGETKLLLLLPKEDAQAISFVRERQAAEEREMGDVTEAFAEAPSDALPAGVPKTDGENSRAYRLRLAVTEATGGEVITFTGEEMAECWVNGVFAGMSLASPHRIKVGPLLRAGENEVLVRLTGNAANLFANALLPAGKEVHIPFGMGV